MSHKGKGSQARRDLKFRQRKNQETQQAIDDSIESFKEKLRLRLKDFSVIGQPGEYHFNIHHGESVQIDVPVSTDFIKQSQECEKLPLYRQMINFVCENDMKFVFLNDLTTEDSVSDSGVNLVTQNEDQSSRVTSCSAESGLVTLSEIQPHTISQVASSSADCEQATSNREQAPVLVVEFEGFEREYSTTDVVKNLLHHQSEPGVVYISTDQPSSERVDIYIDAGNAVVHSTEHVCFKHDECLESCDKMIRFYSNPSLFRGGMALVFIPTVDEWIRRTKKDSVPNLAYHDAFQRFKKNLPKCLLYEVPGQLDCVKIWRRRPPDHAEYSH